MSPTVFLVLALGALFLATRLSRAARLWRDILTDLAAPRAAERAADDRFRTPAPGPGEDAGSPDAADVGVALALALREAELEATGQASRLDAP